MTSFWLFLIFVIAVYQGKKQSTKCWFLKVSRKVFAVQVLCQTYFLSAVQRQSASSMWSCVQDHRLDSCCLAPAELLLIASRSTWSTYGAKTFLLLSCGARAWPSDREVRLLFSFDTIQCQLDTYYKCSSSVSPKTPLTQQPESILTEVIESFKLLFDI